MVAVHHRRRLPIRRLDDVHQLVIEMKQYTSARLYKDVIGRTCCELTKADGTLHGSSGRPMEVGELEALFLPWCERHGVTVIDERQLTTPARIRLDNEAALYKL